MIYTLTLNPAVDRELQVNQISFDSVLRAAAFRVDPGGKGFNVSRMLRALGGNSTALGFAGGKSGDWLRDALHELDIATDFVAVDGETRTNISIVSQADGRYIKVNEPGPTISDAALAQLQQQVSDLAAAGDWWVLAGSLPPGTESDVYATLIAIIEGAGAHVILDTSGDALRTGCSAKPFLVKPNDIEAAAITGRSVTNRAERIDAARAIQALGVANVVLSLGKDGAMVVSEDGVWQAASPSIEARNPIGAGDSMVGGLVWSLARGDQIDEALRWGVACGAATASRDGTEVGDRQQVEQLAQLVKIERL